MQRKIHRSTAQKVKLGIHVYFENKSFFLLNTYFSKFQIFGTIESTLLTKRPVNRDTKKN